MALKIYDTFAPQGNYPAVNAADVEMPDGTRLSEQDFSAGQDGVSPTVSVTTITGGHRVSITDANGTKTFDVMDGEDGADGAGASITVDSALNPNSTNPVQNKVIAQVVAQVEQILAGLTPDAELSETSTNPIQNKAITAVIYEAATMIQQLGASIPDDTHINALIDAKLGVIENGTY